MSTSWFSHTKGTQKRRRFIGFLLFPVLPATPSERESEVKRHDFSIGSSTHLSEKRKNQRFRLMWPDH